MKSNIKKRILAVVLCMVLVLSTGISTMANGEVSVGTTSTPEDTANQEPAAASVEGEAVGTEQEPADESADQDKATETQEEIPTETNTPENTDVPNTDENSVSGVTEMVGGNSSQEGTPEQGTEAGNEITEQETETVSEATELKQEFTDENGNVVQRVTANLPEGAFQASASEITMEVNYLDEATENHLKDLMTKALPENDILGDYILYDIKFKVNGEVTEPQKEITIIFEGSGLHIEDTKKANVFYFDPADPEVQDDKDEIIEIIQKNEMLENLQNAGQSIENIDEYDLSEISVNTDGVAEKIQMEGRTSTIYGCYVEETPEPVQTLTYEDDDVIVNVDAYTENAIPEGTSLKVVPIRPDDKETKEYYNIVEQKIKEKAVKDVYDIAGFLAYDITFIDALGNKVEPEGNVKVSIDYKKEMIPESIEKESIDSTEVTVLHLEENDKGEIKNVVDMNESEQVKEIKTTEDNKIEKVQFETESFSAFTITWKQTDYKVNITLVDTNGNEINVSNPTYYNFSLSKGETFLIANKPEKFNEITDKTGRKTYTFHHASNIWNGATTGGSRVTGLRVKDKKVQWRDNNGGWRGYDSKDRYYFIYQLSEVTGDKLTTKETLDHTKDGITMRMINYSTAANGLGGSIGGNYTENGKTGNIKKNLLHPVLDEGYPRTTKDNTSLKSLFNNGLQVNHLFRQDIYDDTGYYEYSSFENYAYLNQDTKNFTVYDQIGTPSDDNEYFYKRGNFMPYNSIMAGKLSTNKNLYDEDGNGLKQGDPRFGEDLYLTQGTNDFYFGMYMEATFSQPRNGLAEHNNSKSPMRYEFNGDDDLWIYIDDVLVLDIGGIHDAHSGYIDFSTGVVSWKDCVKNGTPKEYKTTIKQMFKDANRLPDSKEVKWDDDKVDQYFEGDTLKDFSIHTFKMFYMERGKGASNLHMKMNLPIIPKDAIEVEKQLTNTDKEKYANVEFAFQVWAQKELGEDTQGNKIYSDTEYETLNSAVYKNTGESVEFAEKEFGGESYNDVFILKPGQVAQFKDLQVDRKYYVVEVGVSAKEYDKIIINGVEYKAYNEDEQIQGVIQDIKTDKATVLERPRVVCENNCSAYNSRELRITKDMPDGQTTKDTFSFRILLTNQNSELVPYANGDYYLMDKSENYYYFNDKNDLVSNGQEAKVCGKTSQDGIVTGVPVGYTVAVTEILSGTNFKVDEVNLDTDAYFDPEKVIVEGTCGEPTVDGADGTILLGKIEAQVNITNRKRANTLRIKKVDSENSNVLAGAEFELERWSEEHSRFEPFIKDDQVYKVITGDDGMAAFDNLENGRYKVIEIKAPEGYVLDENNNSFEVTLPYTKLNPEDPSIIVDEKSKPDESDIYYVITKTVSNIRKSWEIIKRSTNSTSHYLEGAEFELVPSDSGGSRYYGKSNASGKVIWYSDVKFNSSVSEEDIIPGTYTLKETKAPVGYMLSSEYWTIKIGQYGSFISIEGVEKDDMVDSSKKVVFYFDNTVVYELPSAGGPGIFLYIISGILLMMAGALILYKNKHREVLEN